jgi:predicted nucleic acid-binding protein
MIKKILLDKNVVIDLIAARFRKDIVLKKLEDFDSYFISTNTFVTCFYILRKEDQSKEDIYQNLSKFQLLEIDKRDCHLAFDMARHSDDIEDCLELLTAKRNSAKFITSDKKLIQTHQNSFEIVEV